MKLSEKIYQGRKSLGLSQEAFAEKLGVSRQAVSKWETGEATPELYKIPLMAKLFSVSTDYLLTEEEDAFEAPPSSEIRKDAEPPSSDAEQAETPKPQSMRHAWVIGVVIACIGAPFVLIGAAILIITSILTARTVKTDGLFSEVFQQEEVFMFPDGSMPAQWNGEAEKFFFADGSIYEDFLESTETAALPFATGKEE